MKIVEIAPMAVSAKKAMDLKKIATAQADGQKTTAQGSTGTTGTVKPGDTIGRNTSTNQNQMDFARGDELDIPNVDNPNKPEKYKVQAVTGNDVELVPKQNKPGIPKSIKFKKSDLPKTV